MENNCWRHKHLLDTDQIDKTDLDIILALARQYQTFNKQEVRKSDLLKGKTVLLFFAENSTRTRTSFDIAAKRLSADTFSLGITGSSINKGESLKDTALTLRAMNPDLLIVRHWQSGAAKYLADLPICGVINAGDGWHAHPTQALLDIFTLDQIWHGDFKDKTLLILGDIAHSRVARSNLPLLNMLGIKTRICAPRTLLPAEVDSWPVEVFSSLTDAIEGADAVMCLRLQLERQQSGLLPDLSEYSRRFCLSPKLMIKANKDCKILHPGPMNRGMEIDADLAESENCMALNQVEAGVAIRMALLHLLINSYKMAKNPCC